MLQVELALLASIQSISTTKVGRDNITFGVFGYIRERGVWHRDEWWTVRAVDCSGGTAVGSWSIIFIVRVRGSRT